MKGNITIYNYEAYFLDYLEDKLTRSEKEELRHFLSQNPSLESELDVDLSGIELVPEQINFVNKNTLKFEEGVDEINLNTVQTLIIAKIEGLLNPDESQRLEDYIKTHDFEETYKIVKATILKADLNVIFPNKNALKKRRGMIIPFYAKMMRLAAVGIILLSIGLTIERFSRFADPVDSVVSNKYLAPVSPLIPTVQEHVPHAFSFASATTTGLRVPATIVVSNSSKRNSTLMERMDTKKVERIEHTMNATLPSLGFFETEFAQEEINPDEAISLKQNIQSEQPYKLLTDAASDVIRRDITFVRDKNIATSNYVAFRVKIGNFEFERKRGN